jgi:DNA-binding NtrC family response regulator
MLKTLHSDLQSSSSKDARMGKRSTPFTTVLDAAFAGQNCVTVTKKPKRDETETKPYSIPSTFLNFECQVGKKPLRYILQEIVDTVEKNCIHQALMLNKNNRVSTSKTLGISRQALYTKMHRHGLI